VSYCSNVLTLVFQYINKLQTNRPLIGALKPTTEFQPFFFYLKYPVKKLHEVFTTEVIMLEISLRVDT
jgi:hypothetical protein